MHSFVFAFSALPRNPLLCSGQSAPCSKPSPFAEGNAPAHGYRSSKVQCEAIRVSSLQRSAPSFMMQISAQAPAHEKPANGCAPSIEAGSRGRVMIGLQGSSYTQQCAAGCSRDLSGRVEGGLQGQTDSHRNAEILMM